MFLYILYKINQYTVYKVNLQTLYNVNLVKIVLNDSFFV
jgi:hypothetical protein